MGNIFDVSQVEIIDHSAEAALHVAVMNTHSKRASLPAGLQAWHCRA